MKKIKCTMATVAQIATPETIAEKKRNSTDNGQKKNGFLMGLMKALSPNKSKVHHEETAETKKEPTVEDIKEQIEKNDLANASKSLIDLEHKILEDPLLRDKTEELASLYKMLARAVFQVIKDSITKTNGDLLSQAVSIIVEQEKEDAKYVSDNDLTNGSRPKQWKKKWESCIELTVTAKMKKLSYGPANDFSSSLSQSIRTIGKTLKQDLVHVVTHLKEHYPKDFDVCNTYAQHYHSFMVSHVDFITEYELGYEDMYTLLSWVHNYYPNMILKDPILTGHIEESKLNNILSPHRCRKYEADLLVYEKYYVQTFMIRSLEIEVERWKHGNEPEILGNCHHSELHIDTIQIYNGAIKKAGEINKEMVEKVSCFIPHVMNKFLQSYKTDLESFLEKNKAHTFFREISISNLNCCFHFREFIEKKDTNFDLGTQQQMLSIILQCEDVIYAALFQDPFQELTVQFKKMSQSSSLCSYQTMQEIVKTATRFVSSFKTLCPPCYKDMITRIHKHLVIEYLTKLLKRKAMYKNALQLQILANQINENASLINEFCDAHETGEEWLKLVIFKVAEVIRLQDLSAIQLEVATLVRDYPDIRNKQIESILYIKGNLSRQDIRSILKVPDTIDRKTAGKPELFELIKNS